MTYDNENNKKYRCMNSEFETNKVMTFILIT